MENVPLAFAVIEGVRQEIIFANASFRAIAADSGRRVEGLSISRALVTYETDPLTAALDRVRDTGVTESGVVLNSLVARDHPLILSISPDADRESDRVVISVSAEAATRGALDFQREVAERMLLSAIHERDLAEDAEGSRRRASYLASAGSRLTESLEENATLEEMSNLSLSRVGTWCIVDILDAGNSMRRLAIVHPDPERQVLAKELELRWTPEPDDPFGLPAILREPVPLEFDGEIDTILTTAAHNDGVLQILQELGVGSLLTMPLISHGYVTGAITFVSADESRAFSPSELELASELAARAAQALENARLYASSQASRRSAEMSARRYGALVDASSQIVWTTDSAGQFVTEQTDWSEFTGQSFDEYAGNGWLTAIHPDDRAATQAAWEHAVKSRRSCEIEYRIRRHDGVYRTFEVRAVPVLDSEGNVKEWIGAENDVTDRKSAEHERDRLFRAEGDARSAAESAKFDAETANRSKSEFLAAMSHELRTPLNAIAGYVQLLDMGVHGPVTDAQRDALRRVKKSEEHLLSLINDVLNFAKIEAGRVTYLIEDVAIADILENVEEIVRPQLRNKGLAFDDGTKAGTIVRADREKLMQILLNLFSNAIKFTEQGGRIEVSTLERADGAEGATSGVVFVRVSDTGIGIPREKQEIIFDPFIQVHRDLKRPTEGTGLGLSISRDLARGMGGDIRVRSEEGKGSTFTLTLPRQSK